MGVAVEVWVDIPCGDAIHKEVGVGEEVPVGSRRVGDGDGAGVVAYPQAARIMLAAMKTNDIALPDFMLEKTPRAPELISRCLS